MKRILIAALSLLPALLVQPIEAKPISEAVVPRHQSLRTIRVRIAKDIDHCILEAKGRYQLCNPSTGIPMTSPQQGKRALLVLNPSGMSWGKDLSGFQQLRIIPADTTSSLLIDGIQYRGLVDIYNISGKIHVVNEVEIEQYLSSTLTPLEDPHTRDVLECLTILARTHALYLSEKATTALWHVDANVANYRGYGAAFIYPEINDAIERTRGTILTYKNLPFAAAWTEDCAGKTTSYATMFRVDAHAPPPATSPVALKERVHHKWTTSLSKHELSRLLKLPSIQDIELFLDKNSSKVYAVRVKSGNSFKEIDFVTLQNLVGKNKLPSNDFQIKAFSDRFELEGYGKGLGVGLCLYTAEQMIAHGQSTSQILSTFFPGTQIVNTLYPKTAEIVDVADGADQENP